MASRWWPSWPTCTGGSGRWRWSGIGGPIHDKAKVVRAWLAEHPGVVTEKFPGYVPDLNPDEGVWGWTKYGRLANLAANDTDELWDRVIEELIEVKFRPDLLRGFIRQTKLPGVSFAA